MSVVLNAMKEFVSYAERLAGDEKPWNFPDEMHLKTSPQV
jgi:hypothetical protein